MNRPEILRQKITKLVSFLTERKIKVTQVGATAFVEYHPITSLPIRVNLPYIADNATDEFMVAIEGFLDHEVGHILFTAAGAAKRANHAGVMGTWNAIEDTFIERKIAEMFTGSKSNLSQTGEFFLKNYTIPKIKEPGVDPVPFLMVPAIRAWAGQTVFKDFMKDKWSMLGEIPNRIGKFCEEKLPYISNSDEAIEIAVQLKKMLEEPKEPKEDKATGGKGETPEDKGEGEKSTEKEEREEQETSSGDASDSSDSEKPSEPKDSEEDDTDSSEDFEDEDLGDDGDDEDDDSEDTDDSTGEDSSADSDDAESSSKSETGEVEGDEPGDSDSDSEIEADESSTEGGEMSASGDEELDAEEGGSDAELQDTAKADGVDTESEGSEFEAREGVRDVIDFDAIQELMADYDDVLSDELTKSSLDSIDPKDYVVFTRDADYIGPLKERHLRGVSDYHIKDMTDAVDSMVGPLQKDLERAIAARSQAVWTGGHKKGRINATALSKLTMFNDPRCFKQKQETKTRAVAVELVVDCSGSMNGTKIRTACYTAYALASVLERMNIPNEVIGFTTNGGFAGDGDGFDYKEVRKERERFIAAGRDEPEYGRVYPLFIPVFKSFNQGLTPEVVRGIAGTARANWLEENVDGESVLIGANRLMQRHEPRKIMIVLSDGSPACPGNRRALIKHTADSVKRIEASGIEVLGIGIEDSSVTQFYKKNIVLNNVAELPTRVIGEIKRLLMQA